MDYMSDICRNRCVRRLSDYNNAGNSCTEAQLLTAVAVATALVITHGHLTHKAASKT